MDLKKEKGEKAAEKVLNHPPCLGGQGGGTFVEGGKLDGIPVPQKHKISQI